MLYPLHDLHRAWLRPFSVLAATTAQVLRHPSLPVAHVPGASWIAASWELWHRIAKEYRKPAFAIETVVAQGREVVVREETVLERPFCRLVRFARSSDHPETAAALGKEPRVLVVAPLSGHHATLLRDTVRSLLQDHEVWITDWADARDVPLAQGTFGLDDYVLYVEDFLRFLGPADTHVLAVCQPTVPVLAAVSLMASRGEPTPRSLTLMGGPVDGRRSPTAVNRLATERPYAWFEKKLIHRVPPGHAGAGRKVYPGFLQLTAFVSMNPERHFESYVQYAVDRAQGREEQAASHARFYDDYNAVLDMDAPYYLDTIRTVFQDFSLARGTWDVRGERVRPGDVRDTALFTVEGEKDDISGLGQTAAAHDLCTAIPDDRRERFVAPGCGHYGIFSGSNWRESIYPRLRAFIRAHER